MGVNMVKLKIINSMPKTLAITAICIEVVALEKSEPYRKEFLYGLGIFFINHEYNHVVIVLNHSIMMSDYYLTIAY